MKYLICLIILFSSLFADYKITQYYGGHVRLNDSVLKREWITKEYVMSRGRGTMVWFIDKNTGKEVGVSIPFTIEEL